MTLYSLGLKRMILSRPHSDRSAGATQPRAIRAAPAIPLPSMDAAVLQNCAAKTHEMKGAAKKSIAGFTTAGVVLCSQLEERHATGFSGVCAGRSAACTSFGGPHLSIAVALIQM